jgi:ABC-type oligopeptide transport system ATPase subunit
VKNNKQRIAPLLRVRDLVKVYGPRVGRRGRRHVAVDGVSIEIEPGRTFGLVGESGSGKSTVGRAVLRLIEPTSGEIEIAGRDVRAMSARELRAARIDMQMVFQDPYSSLNPRIRVGDTIREAMRIAARTAPKHIDGDVEDLLTQVGLSPQFTRRYPHELSGGQRQRIAIARAMSVSPSLMVLDEPTSALDVSVQKSVLKILADIQAERNLGYLFISHDMAVVRAMADVVGVMRRGRLVEVGEAEQIFEDPQHPYTQQLLAAVPLRPEVMA